MYLYIIHIMRRDRKTLATFWKTPYDTLKLYLPDLFWPTEFKNFVENFKKWRHHGVTALDSSKIKFILYRQQPNHSKAFFILMSNVTLKKVKMSSLDVSGFWLVKIPVSYWSGGQMHRRWLMQFHSDKLLTFILLIFLQL